MHTIRILLTILVLITASTCSQREAETPTGPVRPTVFFSGSTAPCTVYTAYELDTLLTSAFLASGDTIVLADTTFNLNNKAYNPQDKSLHFIGIANAKITKNSGSAALFYFEDTESPYGALSVSFTNVDFDIDYFSNAFLSTWHLNDLRFAGCTITMDDEYINSHADTLVIGGCTIEASSGFSTGAATRSTQADGLIRAYNTVFAINEGVGAAVRLEINNQPGTIVFENSTFDYDNTSLGIAISQTVRNSDSDLVELKLIESSFGNKKVSFDVIPTSAETDLDVVYDLLDPDDCLCPDDMFLFTPSSPTIDWEVDFTGNGYYLSCDDLASIENVSYAKKYCGSTDIILAAFALVADTAETFHYNITPRVRYGAGGGALSETAVVCWNPGVNKWAAEMDVTALHTCGNKMCDVDWEVSVTICEAGTSSVYTQGFAAGAGPCKDPSVCD